jgi:hypothetical protein
LQEAQNLRDDYTKLITLGLQQAELKAELDELQEMYYKILPHCQKAFLGERKKAANDALDKLSTLSISTRSGSGSGVNASVNTSSFITRSVWE